MENSGPPESLKKQLERARFERGIEVAESLAAHRALLTTTELARINRIVCGLPENADPWRQEPVTLTLPSGRVETIALIANPVPATRDRLHQATELAERGATVDAAIDTYVGLVLSHVFKDGNRRTAVLSAHYFLKRYGVPLSGLAIHELGLGDLRQEGEIESLRTTIQQMAKFAARSRGES